VKRKLPPWPPRHADLPSLAELERLSLDTQPPATPQELPSYHPSDWEIGIDDPPPYPASDARTAARCLWSPASK
jgi:hypothetical protein